MRPIISALSIVILLSGCSSAVQSETSSVLTHRYKYLNKGSRSESAVGYLYTPDGSRVPECFIYISDGVNDYYYKENQYLWGEEGYLPVVNKKNIPSSSQQITPEIITRGWYKSAERYSGTPVKWIYAETLTSGYFLDPGKLNELISTEKPSFFKNQNIRLKE